MTSILARSLAWCREELKRREPATYQFNALKSMISELEVVRQKTRISEMTDTHNINGIPYDGRAAMRTGWVVNANPYAKEDWRSMRWISEWWAENADCFRSHCESGPVFIEGAPLELPYKNWLGEVSTRKIQPVRLEFGSTTWHPEPQWLLIAWDVEKEAERSFALKDFNPPTPDDNAPGLVTTDELRKACAMEAEHWPLTSAEVLKLYNQVQAHLVRIIVEGDVVSTPAPSTHVATSADLIERAFEIGFCWRSQLLGQTLEDSRAVGRTLESYIFEGLDIDLDYFNSFESSDAGIVEAKKRIVAALRIAATPPQSRAVAPINHDDADLRPGVITHHEPGEFGEGATVRGHTFSVTAEGDSVRDDYRINEAPNSIDPKRVFPHPLTVETNRLATFIVEAGVAIACLTSDDHHERALAIVAAVQPEPKA